MKDGCPLLLPIPFCSNFGGGRMKAQAMFCVILAILLLTLNSDNWKG